MYRRIGIFPFLFLVLCSCSKMREESQSARNDQEVTYVQGYKPTMVGPNIISTELFEGHASISLDGNEIYFGIYSNDHTFSVIASAVKKNGTWSKPEIVRFSGTYSDVSPALSPDGGRLYFASKRNVTGNGGKEDNDLWYVDRSGSDWGDPVHLPDVSSSYNEFSPSVDRSGNLYFCSDRPGGRGNMDVYFAACKNGVYEEPVLLSDSINTAYREGNVGISPDGNILFFMVQNKPGDYGFDDIHFSVKKSGTWTKSRNLGTIVNTPTYDFAPKVSPDGKTLYFTSRVAGNFDWPDSSYTYDSFRQRLTSPLNGFGNIYRIDLEELPGILLELEKLGP